VPSRMLVLTTHLMWSAEDRPGLIVRNGPYNGAWVVPRVRLHRVQGAGNQSVTKGV
jgi:hypothetical protein